LWITYCSVLNFRAYSYCSPWLPASPDAFRQTRSNKPPTPRPWFKFTDRGPCCIPRYTSWALTTIVFISKYRLYSHVRARRPSSTNSQSFPFSRHRSLVRYVFSLCESLFKIRSSVMVFPRRAVWLWNVHIVINNGIQFDAISAERILYVLLLIY